MGQTGGAISPRRANMSDVEFPSFTIGRGMRTSETSPAKLADVCSALFEVGRNASAEGRRFSWQRLR